MRLNAQNNILKQGIWEKIKVLTLFILQISRFSSDHSLVVPNQVSKEKP